MLAIPCGLIVLASRTIRSKQRHGNAGGFANDAIATSYGGMARTEERATSSKPAQPNTEITEPPADRRLRRPD